MNDSRKRTQADAIASAIGDQKALERFNAARSFLRMHLMVRREIPNGRDFLFSGPAGEVQEALKVLVETEHRANRFLLVDHTRFQEYFLLRIFDRPESQELIDAYFD